MQPGLALTACGDPSRPQEDVQEVRPIDNVAGAASENGQNRTLRPADRPQRSELSGADPGTLTP
jgi:hypothetical protein